MKPPNVDQPDTTTTVLRLFLSGSDRHGQQQEENDSTYAKTSRKKKKIETSVRNKNAGAFWFPEVWKKDVRA